MKKKNMMMIIIMMHDDDDGDIVIALVFFSILLRCYMYCSRDYSLEWITVRSTSSCRGRSVAYEIRI